MAHLHKRPSARPGQVLWMVKLKSQEDFGAWIASFRKFSQVRPTPCVLPPPKKQRVFNVAIF